MDAAWWDRRTLTDKRVVFEAQALPEEEQDSFVEAKAHWIRWRLVDEVMRRFYVDFGLEPGFGFNGVELYNPIIWSPHCRKARRYFGRLCRHGHFHSEADPHLLAQLDLGIAYANLRPVPEEKVGPWLSWPDYLKDAIASFGFNEAGVAGHERCFHRRGKSLTPVMFRAGILLRTEGQPWKRVSLDDGRSVYSYPPRGHAALDEEHLSFLIPFGEHPPASYYVVSWGEKPVAALRTDGVVTTRMGEIDAGALWRGGASEQEIAAAISERIPRG